MEGDRGGGVPDARAAARAGRPRVAAWLRRSLRRDHWRARSATKPARPWGERLHHAPAHRRRLRAVLGVAWRIRARRGRVDVLQARGRHKEIPDGRQRLPRGGSTGAGRAAEAVVLWRGRAWAEGVG